jgi:putative ATP-binding cassette transporter
LFAWLLAATFSSVAAIGLVTSMASNAGSSEVEFEMLALFLLTACLVVVSQYRVLNLTVDVCAMAVESQRREFAQAVRNADLKELEAIGVSHIYGLLNRTTSILSEAGPPVISGLITAVIMLSLVLYTLYLSWLTFVVMVVISVATLYVANHYARLAEPAIASASGVERIYMDLHLQLLDGAKEIKLSAAACKELMDKHLALLGSATHRKKTSAASATSKAASVAYVGVYLLMAVVVFAVPQYLDDAQVSTKITYLSIFMLVLLSILLRALAMLSRANHVLAELGLIKDRLAQHREGNGQASDQINPEFSVIELQALALWSGDKSGSGLQIGPCDAKLIPGNLVAIVGPPGSGRSTLLKAICGLLHPDQGSIMWNGNEVDPASLNDYRSLFAAVFTNSHLFDRWYGLNDAQRKALHARALEFGVPPRCLTGRPEPARLSETQRIKLLLALALCQDRRILVFDDIEACQDEQLLVKLRTDILPGLIQQGKTVVFSATRGSALTAMAHHVINLPEPTVL